MSHRLSPAEIERKYDDPEHGLWSLSKFQHKYKISSEAMNQTSLRKRVPIQETEEFHKNPAAYTSVRAWTPLADIQVDTQFVTHWGGRNDEQYYWLVAIDVYSRYLWVETMSNHDDERTSKAFAKMVSNMHTLLPTQEIANVTTDKGTEFGAKFNAVVASANSTVKGFEKLKPKRWLADVGDKTKMSVVERANRTLRTLFRRWLYIHGQKKDFRYLEILPKLVINYNTTFHRTIGAKPIDVLTGRARNKQLIRNARDTKGRRLLKTGMYKPSHVFGKIHVKGKRNDPQQAIAEGDKVRVMQPLKKFDKRSARAHWSVEIYRVLGHDGFSFTLQQLNNQRAPILKKRRWQILLVDPNSHTPTPVHRNFKRDSEQAIQESKSLIGNRAWEPPERDSDSEDIDSADDDVHVARPEYRGQSRSAPMVRPRRNIRRPARYR